MPSILNTSYNPFIKAYKPFPADHTTNIIDIEIVPIDFEYTSLTISRTKPLIVAGIIFDIASNKVCCSIFVYCIKVISNITNGINDNIV